MTAILSVVLGFLAKLFGAWITKPPAIAPIAEGEGRAEQSAADAQAALKTETAIAQAEAEVVTPAVVVDRLNQGSF